MTKKFKISYLTYLMQVVKKGDPDISLLEFELMSNSFKKYLKRMRVAKFFKGSLIR